MQGTTIQDYCKSMWLLKVPWIQLIMCYKTPTCNPKVNCHK